MKRFSKYLLGLVAVLALAFMIRVPAQAASANLRQTGCNATSATFAWNSLDSYTKYSNYYHFYPLVESYRLETSDGSYSKTITSTGAATYSATLNLPKNYAGTIYLYYDYYSCDYYSENDIRNVYSYTNGYGGSTYGNTVPTTPAKSSFGISSIYSSSSKISFGASRPNSSYQTQFQIYKGNKLVKTVNCYSYTDSISISKNAAYKYRIRYFYQNSGNGKTYYSDWSPYRGFMLSKTVKIKSTSKKKGYTLTFKKASGVKQYRVYSSTTYDSNGKGYKKAKTITAKAKKSYNVRITSKYKKKKYNYIRIVPVLKLSGYSGPSDVITTGDIYVWK